MSDRIKQAFGSVHASEDAKQKALYAVDARRKSTVRRRITGALQIAGACVTAVLAVICINVYISETAYISLDINPSISLAINDYGRVINATAYGPESEKVLSSVRVEGMPYADAVETVMTTSDMQPYLHTDRTVWIAVQARNPVKEAEMEQSVQAAVETALAAGESQMDIAHNAVSEDIRITAEDAGVTATRYIAITELQQVDPSASIDSYRHTSIWEIHEQTASHHAEASEDGTVPDNPPTAETVSPTEPSGTPEPPVPEDTPAPAVTDPPVQQSGHHGHGYGHH